MAGKCAATPQKAGKSTSTESISWLFGNKAFVFYVLIHWGRGPLSSMAIFEGWANLGKMTASTHRGTAQRIYGAT